jgi:L-alanine-DL-glutamate epimerase-like enolase superfamily enzyme
MAVTTAAGPAVDALQTAVYTIPTDAPEADGTLSWEATTIVVVWARSGAATGLGYTYGAAATAKIVSDLLAPIVAEHGVWDVPAANEAMSRQMRNNGRPGLIAGAISAVDIALWDLKARLLGLPLVNLLGASRTQVPVYGSGGFTTYTADRQDRQLRGWAREQGIPRVKIKIGESWGEAVRRDLDRVGRARASVGDGVELYVDANGGYGAKQAIRVAGGLAEHGVTWFEEPVSSDDLDGLARVRAAAAADVAAGEYGYALDYFGRMLAAGAVDCLQADVTRCGGITVWLRAAAVAQAHGLHLSGHCAPHAHAHAAASIPNLRHLEWFHDHVRVENLLFAGTLDPGGGSLSPGADGQPGHGLALRPDQAERYRTG